jgi:hypothetical protein
MAITREEDVVLLDISKTKSDISLYPLKKEAFLYS